MAVNPLSPGVFIDEISVFPPSVAPVATAIPAFIGYTEKAIINGVQWNYGTDGVAPAVRITSMLEYEQIFGVAFPEPFAITLTGPSTLPADTSIAVTGTLSEYTMHYNLRMYFANGGGPCYIVSVQAFPSAISHTDLINGIAITEKADEVTLLVTPEAIASTINSAQRALVHSTMLDLCNKLKDRFSIMDVIAGTNSNTDSATFRNNETGLNNLKYGAAYYPALNTLLTRYYLDSAVGITDSRTGGTFGNTNKLSDVLNGISASGIITISSIGSGNIIKVDTATFVADNTVLGQITFSTGSSDSDATNNLVIAINNASLAVTAVRIPSTTTIKVTAKVAGTTGNSIFLRSGTGGLTPSSPTGTLSGGISADKTLYNNITAALQTNTMRLYPSSTMAGIYAGVDRDRGVWKAPANVSIAGVIAPSLNITAADQENLNVDATSGKSINAIRTFTGKGVLVWGSRTLAGNDNEWRYVPVRRLFIFAEESIGKASEFVVFEPNDRNTWTRVKTLISNFLTNLWRDGALAGATPKEAYFVKVGLGETMTAQDILEGKLIIQVGLAAVRPAEFIILQFSHKLQES